MITGKAAKQASFRDYIGANGGNPGLVGFALRSFGDTLHHLNVMFGGDFASHFTLYQGYPAAFLYPPALEASYMRINEAMFVLGFFKFLQELRDVVFSVGRIRSHESCNGFLLRVIQRLAAGIGNDLLDCKCPAFDMSIPIGITCTPVEIYCFIMEANSVQDFL